MKIGIIGGGSIGLLFAAYLSKSSEVTIYTRTESQALQLQEQGVTLVQNDTSNTYKVNATTSGARVKNEDIAIVAVKQYRLKHVLSDIEDLDKVSTVLFLQNGMGHIEILKNLTNANVLVGVVEHGALKLNDVKVMHTGIGKTKLGVYKGDTEILSRNLNNLSTNHFPIEWHPNWYQMLTEKLIVNAVINPLTSLLRVENGELIHNQYFYKMMKDLFNEVNSIIQQDPEKMWKRVCGICESTSKNKSSMLRDIEENRQTEIDAILGYVLLEAEKKNAMLMLTDFLYKAIKGIEDRGS